MSGGGIAFVGSGGILRLDNNTMPTAAISGFELGDTIDLRGLAFSATNTVSFDAVTSTLTVSGGGVTDTLTLSGIPGGTQFAVISDGAGGTAVVELAVAGGVSWVSAAGGDWNVGSNWSGGVPNSGTDATIGVAGGYTVSLTAPGAANSLSINDTGAELLIGTSAGAASPAILAVQGGVTNSGYVAVFGSGGGELSVGGTLTNFGTVRVGTNVPLSGGLSAAAVVNRNLVAVEGSGTLTTTGSFVNSGSFYVEDQTSSGSSVVSIGGTLSNTGYLQIGNTTLASPTVTVGALANTGSIYLYGGSSTNQAVLDITAGAPAVWTGVLQLSGDALVEFQGGSIGSIANGATISLIGATAFVADQGSLGNNSALGGLASNAGTLRLDGGTQLGITGDLVNNGSLYVDSYNGGSLLSIGGTLDNTNLIEIGNGLSTATTVSAGALANAGTIYVNGGGNASANLDIASAAPSVLTGAFYLSGHAVIDFAGGGSITSIANGALVVLNGGLAAIESAGAAGNSGLSGLQNNAGVLALETGAVITTAGDFVNDAALYIGAYYYGDPGGSELTVGGTLTNSNYIAIGNNLATTGSTVSATALDNAGSIYLYGGTGTQTYQATLDVSAADAPGLLTGYFNLFGNALVEFAGSSSVLSIARTGGVLLSGNTARIANAGDLSSNSALAGLTSNFGTFELDDGATLHIQGDFSNDGALYVDRTYHIYPGGGSSVTVDGTLTNAGNLYISDGIAAPAASSTVTAAYLFNTGGIYLAGGSGTNTYQAILDVTSGSAPSVLTGNFVLTGNALVEFAGSSSVTDIAGGGGVTIVGTNAFFANSATPNSNGALAALASNAGTLTLADGVMLALPGDFSNSGRVYLDSNYGYNGGSLLTIAGTLRNSNAITVGTGSETAPITIQAAYLENTGTITLVGGTGTSASQAILDITSGTAPSVLSGTLNLTGPALVEFGGSGSITSITYGGGVTLIGANALIANAGAPNSNSALTGLASNAGFLNIENGAVLQAGGNLANTGTIYLDAYNYYSGGSAFDVGGTLTNAGYVQIGSSYQLNATTMSVAGLVNRGTLYLIGDASSGQAVLDIAGGAIDSGYISVNGNAVVSAGSLDIVNGGSLYIYSGGTVTDATVDSGGLEYVFSGGVSDSATIAGGTLELNGGTVAAATIDFVGHGGTLQIDTAAMPSNTIVGFGGFQAIDLRAVAGGATGSGSITSSGGSTVLTITESGTSYMLQLDPSRNYTGATVILTSDGYGGTEVTLNIPPIFVSAGQTLTITAGEIEDNVNVLSGGTLIVLSGGTSTDTIDSGTEVLSGGLDVTGLVGGGGTLLVSAGDSRLPRRSGRLANSACCQAAAFTFRR